MRVAIAGAGLMGRLIGWRLTQAGADVALFEKDPAGAPSAAAWVAGGMVSPYAELPESEPEILELARRSLELWPEWLEALGLGWHSTGSLALAHGRDLPLLRQLEAAILRRAEAPIERVAVGEYEPELGERFPQGLLLPGEAWIDNRALLEALAVHGGRIHYERRIEPEALTGADAVLDCRGAGAGEPGLRGVRGEVIRVHAPEVRLSRTVRLMHPRYHLYVAPRAGGHYVIGATQIESDDDGPVTVRSALELLSAAYSLHPGFGEAAITELGVGLRPGFADHLPRVAWRDGVLRVNGLFRHGFLLGPAIAERATEEVIERWV